MQGSIFTDFIYEGTGHGPVGELVGNMAHGNVRFDPGMLRPYKDRFGNKVVTINTGQVKYKPETGESVPILKAFKISELQARGIHSPVFNATALRKEEWIEIDCRVIRAARYRLRAWADLAASNSYGGFNGMNKMILEHETQSDPGVAVVDMDGITEGQTNDAPQFQLQGVPLPITHSDFWFSQRKLANSRNSGTPLDSTMGEAAGRRVAESIEKVTIGNVTGITYGGSSTYVGGYGRASTVYGYLTFPNRITYSSLPVPTGTNPNLILSGVLAMRQLLYNNKFYGPYMLYHSNDWDTYLDNDYYAIGSNSGAVAPTKTLRERLRAIDGIQDVKRLDFLFATIPPAAPGPGAEGVLVGNPFTMIMVQMTPDVCEAVNGMDITTIQWETKGGMQLNFKVMCIQVPRLKADFYNNCGILQGLT